MTAYLEGSYAHRKWNSISPRVSQDCRFQIALERWRRYSCFRRGVVNYYVRHGQLSPGRLLDHDESEKGLDTE